MTLIANLWTPDVWVRGARERQATFPSIFNSGAVIKSGLLDEIATGPGVAANVPFFKDITDQDDEIQVEDTAPSDQGITAEKGVATILNRVTKNSAAALAGQVSGTDPVTEILDQVVERRLKQHQKSLLSILRGLFGSAGAANAAAALSAVRLGGVVSEPFDESGNDATADQLFSPDMFIDAKALMGELQDSLRNGILFLHSNIRARLEKLDKDGFKTGKPSDLPFEITTYRGIPIVISDALVRAGTDNGFVYDTYLLGRNTVGYGSKPQQGDTIDAASLSFFQDKDKNNELLWDRNRLVIHVDGTKWVGAPGGQSATNAELGTVGNWQLKYATANRVGAVCVRTNG
jgi:hypothetical protein